MTREAQTAGRDAERREDRRLGLFLGAGDVRRIQTARREGRGAARMAGCRPTGPRES